MAVALAPPALDISDAPPSPTLQPVVKPPMVSPLALFAAEMMSWLWFAPGRTKSGTVPDGGEQVREVARLQVQPTERFVRFCQEVLSTTQVSVSVVLLALLFVSRLKQQNAIEGAPGSEYRLAVTGLMLANKCLDDQTYTAQTWSQVSSLELKPLVAGEVEFLRGLDWSLHVSEQDYNAWLRLLQGHVASRNARLGKTPPLRSTASFATPVRRPAHNKRPRMPSPPGVYSGLGLTGSWPPFRAGSEEVAIAEAAVESARRTRRKLDVSLSSRNGGSASPPLLSSAPLSAPPAAASSAPLPIYGHLVSNSSTPRSSALRRSTREACLSSSLGKRTATDAFGRSTSAGTATALGLPMSTDAPAMSRSWSAGLAPYPCRPLAFTPQQAQSNATSSCKPLAGEWSCPPLQPFVFQHGGFVSAASSPLQSRPTSSSVTACPPSLAVPNHLHHSGFSTLVDSFSPRYDPEHYRQLQQGRVELGYYALAAGQGVGRYHTMHPVPQASHLGGFVDPFARYPSVPMHPAYPVSMSVASSPIARASRRYSPPGFAYYAGQPVPAYTQPAYALSPLSSRPPSLATTHSSGYRRVSGESASSPLGSTTSTPLSMYDPPAPAPSLQTTTKTPLRATGPYELPPMYAGFAPSLAHLHPAQQAYSAYSNAGMPGVCWRG